MKVAAGRLSRSIASGFPHIQDVITAIPYMSLPIRKCFLSLCQIQQYPLERSRARLRLGKTMQLKFPAFIHSAKEVQLVNLNSLLQPVSLYLQSPCIAGLFSMLLRNLQFEEIDSVKDAFTEGLEKELRSALEVYRPTVFVWGTMLSHDPYIRHNNSVIPCLDPDPKIVDHLYNSIQGIRGSLANARFYPDYSNKTVGREAIRTLKFLEKTILKDLDFEYSTFGLEWIYHKTGIEVSGCTEVRWAWLYSQLKPRIYYARGPTTYNKSKYIQQFYNLLIDSLSITDRFRRFLVTTIELLYGDMFFIYDYRSFTSALEEIRNMTGSLAECFEGVWIEVVDTRYGPQRVSLKDMLDQFNDACNNSPEMDVSGCIWDKSERDVDPVFCNHSCGMLGVPGNISGCTFLHGCHLALVLHHIMCKCVGDDAAGKTDIAIHRFLELLQGIGLVNEEKLETWRVKEYEFFSEDIESREFDETWHYVKRPINIVGTKILAGSQTTWPSIAYAARQTDEFHTTHYSDDIRGHQMRVASSLITFGRDLQNIPPLSYDEEILVDRYFKEVLIISGLEERDKETHRLVRLTTLVYPRQFKQAMDASEFLEEYWNTPVKGPSSEPTSQPEIMTPYVSRSSKALKLCRDFGYCSMEKKLEWFLPRDDPTRFLDVYFSAVFVYPHLYDVVVYESCPSWLFTLIVDEHNVPQKDEDSDHSDNEE